MIVGPQNSLRCLDTKTGQQKWALSFGSAPVAAYAEGGSVNTLLGHPLPHPVSPKRRGLTPLQSGGISVHYPMR